MRHLSPHWQPELPTHGGRVSRLRHAVGCGAVLATVPYLALKIGWLVGGTAGMADPAFFHNATYFYANVVTVAMDGVAVFVALAFTASWGRRIPAPLILLPTWLATGFLLPIVALLPIVIATGSWPARGDGPLQPWVYQLVYTTFALQGALLLAAFALYARARWGAALGQLRAASAALLPRALLALLAASLTAGAVGAAHLFWALGGTIGMSDAFAARQTSVDHIAHGVYGAFALAAAAGAPALVLRAGRVGRERLPLAVSWAGTGAMVTWGAWLLATGVASASDAPGYFFVLLAQVVAGGGLAGVAARALVRRRRVSCSPQPRG